MLHNMQDIPIPHFNLNGKTAVVTGGTKGLGYGIALTYASYGANVAVSARTPADCARVEEELKSLGVKALGLPTDVTDAAEVDRLLQTVSERLGPVDIMVCNAGISHTAKALDMHESAWDEVINTNLKGVFLSARAAARQMIAAGKGGRIINIASAIGLVGGVGISAYGAAKAGVVNLTKTLAAEWTRYGITVNALCPGYVHTSLNDEVFSDPAVLEKITRRTALRRLGRIEEIAAAALYLASDFSEFMTGAHLLIDGGESLP